MRNERDLPEVGTLLFLTSGPYFFPMEKTVRARYELLSEQFHGFILSFVSEKEWQHVSIGRFELIGRLIAARTYRILLLRLLVRAWFVLTCGVRLHRSRRRIDVIIAYDPFVTGLLGYVLSRVIGAKLVVEVNNDFGNAANWSRESWDLLTYLKSAFVRFTAPIVVNRADLVKLLYEGQVASFRRLKKTVKYVYFPDFVATSLFRPGTARSKRILFVGHPWYVKGVDVLLRAFNAVSTDFPDWQLRIVGYLPERTQYRELFETNPNIEFLGPVMPDAVIDLMADCALVVLASRSEGMPRVLIEAMAAGKAIVASRVGGIPHYIVHGETGFLFDSGDEAALARLLRRLLRSDDLPRMVGERAHRYVDARLSDRCWAYAMGQALEATLRQ